MVIALGESALNGVQFQDDDNNLVENMNILR